MPRMFESQGYKANIFHMNSGDFYSRRINYNSWGYENYWGLCEVTDYKNHDEYLDRELILNDVFYDKMFVSVEKPFITYLITYTLHKPFNANKDAAKKVAEVKYGKGNIPKMSEEECIYMQVEETDYMIGLLMQALKDNGLYDNTVIITYTDHYLYTIADKSILDNHKDTYENVINHTPFFIWSSDVTPQKIDKTNMQIDILPTVLNLFGIDYNSNNYLGYDIFSNQTDGYAFFNDYSWYDSNIYVKDGKVTRGQTNDNDYVSEINKRISDIIKKNDLTLKYDYFRSVESK